jgi:hypothetical protein
MLYQEYITITQHKLRFLPVDGAREFVVSNMKEFCRINKIVLQSVKSYSHTVHTLEADRETGDDLFGGDTDLQYHYCQEPKKYSVPNQGGLVRLAKQV